MSTSKSQRMLYSELNADYLFKKKESKCNIFKCRELFSTHWINNECVSIMPSIYPSMEFLGADIADIFPIMKTNSRIYSFNNYKGRYYFPDCGISKPKA